MELRDYIEAGELAVGSGKQLAGKLGVAATSIPDAKAGRRGLPLAACYKLAELIEARPEAVAAASALVTEKDEGTRAYLAPFVEADASARRAAAAQKAAAETTTAPEREPSENGGGQSRNRTTDTRIFNHRPRIRD